MTITDIPRGDKRARCFAESPTTVLFVIAEVSDEGQYFETCYDTLTEPQVEQAIEALQAGLRGEASVPRKHPE